MSQPQKPRNAFNPTQLQILGFCLACAAFLLAVLVRWLNVPFLPRDIFFIVIVGSVGAASALYGTAWDLWRSLKRGWP